ncbi:MAG: Gfo/Idh/MocA family oxidoreductase [Tepidisphaeraceae bacterium]|jgi:predicted dehydrogenase
MELTVMDRVKSVALVGMGGYGHIYVNALLGAGPASGIQFVAGIDPSPEGCHRLAEVRQLGIPLFKSLEEFCASGRADLVVLSSPPQLHCEQACLALGAGSHVLCEKPLGAQPEETTRMIEARDRAGRQLAIGYQWSFCPSVQHLKRDIAAGRFGQPRRLRTRVYWPRDEKYYGRSPWAGRQRDAQGRLVLDSPANNACAHQLHNMFYVLGEAPDRSDWPAAVQAELYRANAIENYDTIALRCITAHGTEVLFFASHATRFQRDPLFSYEFDDGIVHYGGKIGDRIVAQRSDGSLIDYGTPASADSPQKLFDVLESIREDRAVVCGPEAAGAQTACIYAAQLSTPNIVDFPRDLVVVEGNPGERRTSVKDLDVSLDKCYEQGRLPSEIGISWSVAGKKITPAGQSRAGGNAAGEKGSVGPDAILQPVNTPRRMAVKS